MIIIDILSYIMMGLAVLFLVLSPLAVIYIFFCAFTDRDLDGKPNKGKTDIDFWW